MSSVRKPTIEDCYSLTIFFCHAIIVLSKIIYAYTVQIILFNDKEAVHGIQF